MRLVLLLVLQMLVPLAGWAQPAGAVIDDVREQIRHRLESGSAQARLAVGADLIHAHLALPRFYQSRLYRPAWLTSDGLTSDAQVLLAELRRADEEGLRPGDYHLVPLDGLMGELSGRPDPSALASLDLLLTDAFLVYGSHVLAGRTNPETVDPEWHASRPAADLVGVLERALRDDAVSVELQSLRPRHPHYAALKGALARLKTMQAEGGWSLVPAGSAMELGVRDARVRSLRQRLVASEDLSSVAADLTAFDDAVDAAVRRFQRRHGLVVDGVVGPATRRALNVPLDERIEQVILNLERWRWLPQDLGSRYVLVNIPAFELTVVEDTAPVLSMRVVVGRDYRRTPVLSSAITHLVLNPYWRVPATIARRDLLPMIQADPLYLRRQGMKVFRTREGRLLEVDPDDIDWSAQSSREFPFLVRQDPGPRNALGSVKFVFPNRFDVYLHDSPARALFAQAERAASAGCIRVERPLELAAYMLRGDSSWTPSRLQESLSTAYDRTVRLPEPIPVHLLYWTAWVDDEGLHFRRDVYGRDGPLAAAMREPPPQP